MKHFHFDSPTATTQPADVSKDILKPGDSSTGISADKAAMAAACNVIGGDLSPIRVAAITANFIEALAGEKPNRLPTSIAAINSRTTRDAFECGHYQPHRTIREHVDHQNYVKHLLSPSLNDNVLECLSETWPGALAESHAQHLDTVRAKSKQAGDCGYDLIIRGELRAALIAHRDGMLGAHVPRLIIEVIRNHARCFAIRTAHAKIEILRLHGTGLADHRFSGFNQWPLVGHLCMATVAAPAAIVQRLASEERSDTIDDLNGEVTFNELATRKILPPELTGRKVMDIALQVRRILKTRRRGRGEYDFAAALNYVSRGCSTAAALDRSDMRLDELSRIDLSEYRLGLSASEGASYIALELHRAFFHIDACIQAILTGAPLCAQASLEIPKKALAFSSVILRTEGRSDKNAPKIERHRAALGRELDKSRGSGRIPMLAMLEKLKNPELQQRVRQDLGIDATKFFER